MAEHADQVLLEIFRSEIRWYHFQTPEAVNTVTGRTRTAAVRKLAKEGLVDIGEAEPGAYSVPSLIRDEPGVCNCESYDCSGECCGVGNCTCTPEGPGSTSPEPGPPCGHVPGTDCECNGNDQPRHSTEDGIE